MPWLLTFGARNRAGLDPNPSLPTASFNWPILRKCQNRKEMHRKRRWSKTTMSLMTGERALPNDKSQHTKIFFQGQADLQHWLCRSVKILRPRLSECHINEDTAENTKMNDCYCENKDWRLCKNEVSVVGASEFSDFVLYHVYSQ
jgi:hypothetical protein